MHRSLLVHMPVNDRCFSSHTIRCLSKSNWDEKHTGAPCSFSFKYFVPEKSSRKLALPYEMKVQLKS